MMPKKEDSKTMNVIKENKREQTSEKEVDVEHFSVKMLKEMLWIFIVEMGRGGCPICTYFSPMF